MTTPSVTGVSNNLFSILCMLLASAFATSMMGFVRHLSDGGLHPFEIAFFRNFFGLILLLPLLWKFGMGSLKTDKFGLQAFRGVCNATSMLLYFTAVTMIPIAKVSALNFTTPLFVTLGAVLVLRERMGIRRWTGLVLGFAGAIIILRPGLEIIHPGAMFALASAFVWGTAVIIIKILSRTDSPFTITIYGALFLTPITFVAALFFWRNPTLEELGWLIILGALGSSAQFLFAQSLKGADATLVMPFDFTKLIWASLIGYLFYAEIPVIWTWLGGGVIFTSAVYIAYRERLAERN